MHRKSRFTISKIFDMPTLKVVRFRTFAQLRIISVQVEWHGEWLQRAPGTLDIQLKCLIYSGTEKYPPRLR